MGALPVVAKFDLVERVWRCRQCGVTMEADEKAEPLCGPDVQQIDSPTAYAIVAAWSRLSNLLFRFAAQGQVPGGE